MSRRTARKQAFFLLYQSDVNEIPVADSLARWREYRGDLEPYAIRLCRGVEDGRVEMDEVLSGVSVGWSVRRMSAVDRTILRLSLFEMTEVEDVPPDVAINEAIELATGFSSDEAPGFVGGVLRGARAKLYPPDEKKPGVAKDDTGETHLRGPHFGEWVGHG